MVGMRWDYTVNSKEIKTGVSAQGKKECRKTENWRYAVLL